MSDKKFNWEAFQRHLRYDDEDLKAFQSDEKRVEAAKKLFSKDIMKKELVIEVVESHGCSCGLKPGDQLIFNGLAVLDTGRSCPNWCAHAMMPVPMLATLAQDRFVSGLDINNMVYDHFSCGDVGPRRHGWGQIVMKGYVRDKA